MKRLISSCSLLNALITLTPVRFSLVIPRILSSPDCTFLYIGLVASMIPNTISASTGIAATNTSAAFTSIVNAIIIAPNTINGERRNSRSTMLIPFCTWLISLVILVTSVDVPSVSISVNENVWICANKLCLIPVAAPTAALALKYCAVMAHTSPMIARSISIRHICIMYPLSALTIPLSITDDTTSGTNSSNIASSILKSGARTHSFL